MTVKIQAQRLGNAQKGAEMPPDRGVHFAFALTVPVHFAGAFCLCILLVNCCWWAVYAIMFLFRISAFVPCLENKENQSMHFAYSHSQSACVCDGDGGHMMVMRMHSDSVF